MNELEEIPAYAGMTEILGSLISKTHVAPWRAKASLTGQLIKSCGEVTVFKRSLKEVAS